MSVCGVGWGGVRGGGEKRLVPGSCVFTSLSKHLQEIEREREAHLDTQSKQAGDPDSLHGAREEATAPAFNQTLRADRRGEEERKERREMLRTRWSYSNHGQRKHSC